MLLGGNGILLEHNVGRFVADAEAIYSYEGTREMNTLIVGRALTGSRGWDFQRAGRGSGFFLLGRRPEPTLGASRFADAGPGQGPASGFGGRQLGGGAGSRRGSLGSTH